MGNRNEIEAFFREWSKTTRLYEDKYQELIEFTLGFCDSKTIMGSDKYKYCNHHHELDSEHEMVGFGYGEFVANKQAIPLLKALNEIGLQTRSHHIDDKENAWVSIILDNVEIEVRDVFERDADRTKYNGKKELLLKWIK